MAKRQIIPIFIPHYGCIHDCVFCNQRSISGASDPPTAQKVHQIVKSAILEGLSGINPSRPVELAFYGGSFTALPIPQQIEYLSSAQALIAQRPDNCIRISTRPDCIDSKAVQMLIGYGVKIIELGAQSMCEDVLLKSNRGHSPSDVVTASKIIKSSGLSLILQMMTGLPGDSSEKSIYTANELAKLEPSGVRIYPTAIVKGTELYRMWKRGEYKEHSVDEAVELCSVLYAIFELAGIPVIRLGLNPSDDLSREVAAGAYHPAFGELVYSRLYYNTASELLKNTAPGSDAVILVPKGHLSQMIGRKRENITKLKAEYALNSLKVLESDCERAELF